MYIFVGVGLTDCAQSKQDTEGASNKSCVFFAYRLERAECVEVTQERFLRKNQRNADKLSIMPVSEKSLSNLTGGSRLGKPNALTVSVKEAVERAFDKLGGASYLEHVGRTDPRTFCALLSKLLPTKLANADGSPLLAALTELTDAQLEARTARALADASRAGLMASPGPVIEVAAEAVQAPIVSSTEPES
jgi:hypothetical protein